MVKQGRLYLNEFGKLEFKYIDQNGAFDTKYFSCGSCLEIFVDNKWLETRIEHNGKDYYFYDYPEIEPLGVEARTISKEKQNEYGMYARF